MNVFNIKSKLLSFICLSYFLTDLICQTAWAEQNKMYVPRKVYTDDDRTRLRGYRDFYKELKEHEKDISSGLKSFENEKKQYELERQLTLKEYLESPKGPLSNDESLAYKKYLKEKTKEFYSQELIRKEYIHQNQELDRKTKKEILVSEEQELGLLDKNLRADWNKRNLYGDSRTSLKFSGGSNGSGYSSGSDGFNNRDSNDFAPENDYIPPPPPPPVFDSPSFEDALPPPPPPLFDDEGF